MNKDQVFAWVRQLDPGGSRRISGCGIDTLMSLSQLAFDAGRGPAVDALVALSYMKKGECWCGLAIGDPRVHEHSKACRQAQSIVKGESHE